MDAAGGSRYGVAMKTRTLLPLLLLAGCGIDQSPCGPGGVESARMQLLATDVEFARHASERDIGEAFAAVLAPDAVFLPMNHPALYGPDDIVEFFSDTGGLRLGWTPADAEVARGCDIGYTFGAWRAQGEDADGNRLDFHGKYLGAWRHDAERGWRLAVYMQNAD